MKTQISSAAALLGRKGGLVKSKAKRKASAENGKKGGRPRKEVKSEEQKSQRDTIPLDNTIKET